jgi:hypothetical protein
LGAYENAHGTEARGLEDLSLPNEATIDPFTGTPLILRKSPDGWVIYTVMENGIDDGGKFKDLKDYGLAPPGFEKKESGPPADESDQ